MERMRNAEFGMRNVPAFAKVTAWQGRVLRAGARVLSCSGPARATFVALLFVLTASTARAAEGWRLPSVYMEGADNALQVEPTPGGYANAAISGPIEAANVADVPVYGLTEAQAAFGADRSAPQYWLGDALTPPSGTVDWEATKAALPASIAGSILVDPVTKTIYAVRGGTISITWHLTEADGTTTQQMVNYQVSSSASGRPLRLFWTNAPYNGPTVSFNNAYVRLLGIDDPVEEVDPVSQTSSVVHGVYVDQKTMLLHAIQGDLTKFPMLTGQMVVAYYDSGLYDRLLGLVVVEISPPNPLDRTAFVGEALKPYGSGHDTRGLKPFPIYVSPTDNRGDYYYQHHGTLASDSPKNLNVYPLRPTEALNTRLQVWWKEYDPFDTLWPFEFCRYQCSWGSNAITFVRGPKGSDPGLPLTFDSALTAELQRYQEPEGHADPVDAEAHAFSTHVVSDADHYSLLKLTGDDNVWFLPVRSVACNDPRYFESVSEPWLVGEEVVPRGGSVMGTAEGYTPAIDRSVAGYLYAPHSGTHYNAEAYYLKDTSPEGATQIHEYPSAIFPVNVDPEGRPLEVWWSSSWSPDDLPAPVVYPSLAQSYAVRWPSRLEAPRIVLASQLGSAMKSTFASGKALNFDSPSTSLPLPSAAPFSKQSGTVAFWMRAEAGTTGTLLTLGSTAGAFKIQFTLAGEQLQVSLPGRTLTSEAITDGQWHKVAVRFDINHCALQIDGADVATAAPPALIDCEQPLDNSYVGSAEQTLAVVRAKGVTSAESGSAPVGADFDALTIWWEALTEVDFDPPAGAPGLLLNLTFDDADEMQLTATTRRLVREQVSGLALSVTGALTCEPGAPRTESGVIVSDTDPTIYTQNDPSAPGYNPNEEHAIIRPGEGGYVAWAIRDDLNTDATSACGVLVSYTQGGARKMRWFTVERTDETYPSLAGTTQAGTLMPGPHPLDFLDGFWNTKNNWSAGAGSPFRDRKNQIWTVCEENFDIYLWYPFQSGFYCPGQATQPAVGDLLPWLDGERASSDEAWSYNQAPSPWTWQVKWPTGVPTMGLGQTLTVAEKGLPEVWGAKSMAIIWPKWEEREAMARLYDPTVMQTAGLAPSKKYTTTQEFIQAAGFDISEKGNALYRNGTYKLRNLPPSIADRFTIDPNRPLDKALGLIGLREEGAASTQLLYLNVLSSTERTALAGALSFAPADIQKAWKAAVEKLATDVVIPLRYSDVGKEVTYSPVDHYALTTLGKTGYLTLIENDSDDTDVVKPGDPISMHVVKVEPKLVAAPLAVREDPTNLLSQQLSILYGEVFAGRSNEWVFEWRKRLPDSTGVIPTDIERSGYDAVGTPATGWTQLLLGAAGDSLENLVNTYYAVRYRPVEGTAAYTAMKAAAEQSGEAVTTPDDPRMWSAWSGPTLAEGWVQRVLNNITPFTQPMTDLYTNPVETATTMIQKAGAPYAGDVALNSDNLAKTGLIQLYMTMLSKAEAMSVANGPTLAAANEQLLLAATRAADLYSVLGDEAYTDALNPTIGFGADFATDTAPGLGLDYGALATRLFCFDNQVPTLLDEELALLRGRGADYQSAGVLRTGPYYNRLPWNYTRGMTAGEVAYAVNYNITDTQVSSVDIESAAALFPQGHGDAYGHYLSAIKLYYRLLRNPNFSWGTPGMGEMLLGDSVLNVDYYDENRFGELAESLAEAARATFDRTARKSFAETGGAAGSGYVDSDPERGFGYGEWATKAGLGALYNWAVGNSLLPEAPDPAYYQQATFTSGEYQTGFFATLPADLGASQRAEDGVSWVPFTVEFQVVPEASQPFTGAVLATWQSGEAWLALALDPGLSLSVMTSPVEGVSVDEPVATLPAGVRSIIALGRKANGDLSLRVLSTTGAVLGEIALPNVGLAGGDLALGSMLRGALHEIRWWRVWRSNEDLAANCDVVAANSTNLALYLRTFTRERAPSFLTDWAAGIDWAVTGATWVDFAASGLTLALEDAGLAKIDRASATSLDALTQTMEDVVEALDRLDLGLNPLGLSDNAVPFDITPLGVDDGQSSHFEQILARAEVAVKNAAAILDQAQVSGSRLRQLEEARLDLEQRLDAQELAYEADLVGYYGTPYTDDIGPSGLYAQGYTGADYYHYMYMDLAAYGLSGDISSSTNVVHRTYELDEVDYSKLTVASFDLKEKGQVSIPYTVSNDGFVMKPASFKGSRQTVGKLQQAYADALVEYVAFEEAKLLVTRKEDVLKATAKNVESLYNYRKDYFITWEVLNGLKMVAQDVLKIASLVDTSCQASTEISSFVMQNVADASKIWAIGGVAVGTNAAGVAGQTVANTVNTPIKISSTISNATYRVAKSVEECVTKAFDQALELYGKDVELVERLSTLRSDIFGAISGYYDAVTALREAAARLTTATQAFSALRAEAETLREQRELARQQAVNAVTRLRYNDMFFRQVRNEALVRYDKAFETAQRYVYLAAQAYGYETASSMDALRAKIVGARLLGAFDATGEPIASGAGEDGGLAGILAQMKADWLAVKGLLGINNPQPEVTWFSLRQGLLRIPLDASGDQAWQDALERWVVEDVRSHAWYRRYCQPMGGTDAMAEPALVIPFASVIEHAQNFFGLGQMVGDSAYSPTHYATRIHGAGVYLKGYDEVNSALAATPAVYLMPLGKDYFRLPGGGAQDVVSCNVVDQVVPLPYSVADSAGALQLYDGYTGGVDRGLRIRRYPSFRAAYGAEAPARTDGSALSSTRLVGRSVWNDRWALIIPFGAMNAERDLARAAFIHGYDSNNDGKYEVGGVKDILIGLRTYSHMGY